MDRWLVNRQGREKLRRIVDRIEALANAGSAKPDGCRLRSGQIMNPRHPLLPVFVGQVYRTPKSGPTYLPVSPPSHHQNQFH